MSHRSNHSIDMNTNFSPTKPPPSDSKVDGASQMQGDTKSTPKHNADGTMHQAPLANVQRAGGYTVTAPADLAIADGPDSLTSSPDQIPAEITYEGINELQPSADMVLCDIYDVLNRDLGAATANSFKNASVRPPITRESLAELNTSRIMNSATLRHDVNFDRDLQYRPNVSGAKGKEKKKAVGQYWLAIRGELHMYTRVQAALQHPSQTTPSSYILAIQQLSHQRLPDLFLAIREIIRSLVPDCDHPHIVDTLDVPLLMQQIDNGVCDLTALAYWFANILKNHCAPMRDVVVDKMRDQLCAGALDGDMAAITEGLRQLLTVLEMMKLDVANHQIRQARPKLVYESVSFQISYNAKRVAEGKINLEKCRAWFFEAKTSYIEQVHHHTDIQILCGLVVRGLLTRDDLAFLSPLFHLDMERLVTMRLELRRLVFLNVCAYVFEDVVGVGAEEFEKKKESKALCTTMFDLLGTSSKFTEHLENLSVEIMRSVFRVEKREDKFDRQLLDFITYRLEEAIKHQSCFYEYATHDLCSRFTSELAAYVTALAPLPAQTLQNMLVPVALGPKHNRIYPNPRNPSFVNALTDPDLALSPINELEYDLLNRMTHMLVLHWQVWRESVYQSPLLPPMPQFPRPWTPVQSDDEGAGSGPGSDGISPTRSSRAYSDPFVTGGAKLAQDNLTGVTQGLPPTPSPSPPPRSEYLKSLKSVELVVSVLETEDDAMETDSVASFGSDDSAVGS